MSNIATYLARQANKTAVGALKDRYEELKLQMHLISKRLIREQLEMIQLVVYCDGEMRKEHPGMIRLKGITKKLAGYTTHSIFEDTDLQDLLDEGCQIVNDYRWY